MFDKEAIEALQYGGGTVEVAHAVRSAFANKEPVGIPDKFKLHSLEAFMPHRQRARGMMDTTAIDSFAQYVSAHASEGTTVFVDAQAMTATAVLNLGTTSQPGHADDLAEVRAKPTAAYQALLAIAGRPQSQGQAAEFLEDWCDAVRCFDDDSAIKTPSAIAAVRKLTIEAMRKVESEEQSLSASKSTFESVTAKSNDQIPKFVYFKCVPYMELEERTFVMRFGIQTGGDKPSIILRIIKAEEHQQEMAQEFAEKVADSFIETTNRPVVLIGSYKPRQ